MVEVEVVAVEVVVMVGGGGGGSIGPHLAGVELVVAVHVERLRQPLLVVEVDAAREIVEHLLDVLLEHLLHEEVAQHVGDRARAALLLVDDREGVVDDREEDVHQDEDDEHDERHEEQRREHAVAPPQRVVVEDAEEELEEREEGLGHAAIVLDVEAEREVEGHREAGDDDHEDGGEEEQVEPRLRERGEEQVHLRDDGDVLEHLDEEEEAVHRVEVLHLWRGDGGCEVWGVRCGAWGVTQSR